MATKLGIMFLGMTVGGATFLVAGFACSLIIAQVQYSTIETRVARAIAAHEVSTRAKDAPVIRYERVANTR